MLTFKGMPKKKLRNIQRMESGGGGEGEIIVSQKLQKEAISEKRKW